MAQESFRRRSLGTAVMRACLQLLSERTPCDIVTLHVKSDNLAALAFYQKCAAPHAMRSVSRRQCPALTSLYWQVWLLHRPQWLLQRPLPHRRRDVPCVQTDVRDAAAREHVVSGLPATISLHSHLRLRGTLISDSLSDSSPSEPVFNYHAFRTLQRPSWAPRSGSAGLYSPS